MMHKRRHVKAKTHPGSIYSNACTLVSCGFLMVSAALQGLLMIQGLASDSLSPLAFLGLGGVIVLSNLAALFTFAEMLKDDPAYKPRFDKAWRLHAAMTAGFCATFLAQVVVYTQSEQHPSVWLPTWIKLATTFLPLLIISHAGTYIRVNTWVSHPYYIAKYGYVKPSARQRY